MLTTQAGGRRSLDWRLLYNIIARAEIVVHNKLRAVRTSSDRGRQTR